MSDKTGDKIREMLERYGEALSAGDTTAVSSCWTVPALVLSDQGAISVSDPAEIEAFFGQATDWYRSQGIISTRPELERIEMLTEKVASVDVRWPAFDAAGAEVSSERSHYLVALGEDGLARVRVALTRTV